MAQGLRGRAVDSFAPGPCSVQEDAQGGGHTEPRLTPADVTVCSGSRTAIGAAPRRPTRTRHSLWVKPTQLFKSQGGLLQQDKPGSLFTGKTLPRELCLQLAIGGHLLASSEAPLRGLQGPQGQRIRAQSMIKEVGLLSLP